jgi:DNA-nicking Smr family endonuclease
MDRNDYLHIRKTTHFRSRKLSEIFICGMMKPEMKEPDAIELPINGVLDLHTFRPADVKTLVPEYLDECRKRGIYQIRIIHGRGGCKRAKQFFASAINYGHITDNPFDTRRHRLDW